VIRPLLITALCAFLAAVGFFGAAAALAGPDIRKLVNEYGVDFDDDYAGSPAAGGGPEVARTLAWDGDDELSVQVPATVHYTQGPAVSLAIKGPKGTVEHIVVDDGAIKFDRRMHNAQRVDIVMSAPNVTQFRMLGSQRLEIQGYKQAKLEASILGSGKVVAQGFADEVELHIAGSGDIDAGQVAARKAEVNIGGSGNAVIAPTEEVEVHIGGSGDVTLKTNPPRVDTHIAGSGRIIHDDAPSPAPAAPAPAKATAKLELS
jgi:hypothetical protein